jgi:hypothetical protein
MKSQNSKSILSNIQQNLNNIIVSYNTVNMILNPTLNNYKQNFLSSFTSTIISQLNFLIALTKEKDQNEDKINQLIQSNITNYSKNIANLLSFVNEKKFILNNIHENSFSLIHNSLNLTNKNLNSLKFNENSNIKNSSNKITNYNHNKKEIKITKKCNSSEKFNKSLPSYFKKSKIMNEIKTKISQQLLKKRPFEKIRNKSLENYHTLPNTKNPLLKSQSSIKNKTVNLNLRYSHRIKKSSPIILNEISRSKSAIKGKYKKSNILGKDFFNEKITTEFEEKGAKPTPFTKYLITRYKSVVENYEKLDMDEQIKLAEIKNKSNRSSKGKNKIKKNDSYKKMNSFDKNNLVLRNSNKSSDNNSNNNTLVPKIIVVKKNDNN